MSAYGKEVFDHLAFLYGEERAPSLTERLLALLDRFRQDHHELHEKAGEDRISERDAILITYGDMIQEPGKAHLQVLAEFLEQYVSEAISTVHILPFYPFSSDDGFSVIDYRQVNPSIGTWEEISRIGRNFRLMFDAVINHTSAQSEWFQGFLRDDPRYTDYFTVIDPGIDLSSVFRPRSSPLLTPVRTPSGEKLVWTTFSADQVDLNFRSPDLLIEIIETLLYYIDQGAEFLRLDAVTFLWKEIGTSSANLPQTHRIIQLLRTVLNQVAPHVTIITETNIPHKENISYFGDGFNELGLVHHVGQLIHDDLFPITFHFLHMSLCPDGKGSPTCGVCLEDTAPPVDDASCGKVGTLDVFHQSGDLDLRFLHEGDETIDQFREVVGWDAGCHPHSDTGGTIDKEIREL